MVLVTGICLGNENLPDAFQPSRSESLDVRVSSLELAVIDLSARMREVEKATDETNLRRIGKEIVSAELQVKSASGQQQKRVVQFAGGYGAFDLAPGEQLVAIDGVPVANVVHSQPYQGQPAVMYSQGGYDVRVVNTGARNRVFMRRARVAQAATTVVAQPNATCRVVNGVMVCTP